MKIYFAGPLFTTYERDYISTSAAVLRQAGIDVFVPHEGNDEMVEDGRSRAKMIYDADFAGVAGANAILALLNGAEVDDGTACEIGIFHGLMQTDPTKKGIVGLLDDWRIKEPDGEGKSTNRVVRGCIEASGAIYNNMDECIAHLLKYKAELDEEGLS